MKLFKKMLLLNWHNFVLQEIDFSKINFLTGKTGTGKSTVIDAMQLVLFADTEGKTFNKAASSKSARTLQSYLFGEQGDDGGTGFRMLRGDKPFTSIIALEYFDDEKNLPFTIGFIADCHEDKSYDSKWFSLPKTGIPKNQFLKNEIPMNLNKLKAYFGEELKKDVDYKFIDTNKAFRDEVLKLFSLDERYFTLLKKAVPFTPISDITKFITESICDVEDTIDIDEMSVDIRSYSDLEKQVAKMEEKISRLKVISSKYNSWKEDEEQLKIYKYICDKGEEAELKNALENVKRDKEKLLIDKELTLKTLENLKIEIEKIEQIKEDKTLELSQSDEYKRKDYEKEKNEKEAEVKRRTDDFYAVLNGYTNKAFLYKDSLQCLRKRNLKLDKKDESLLLAAISLNEESIFNFSLSAFSLLTRFINEEMNNEIRKAKEEQDILAQKVSTLRKEIGSLEQGIKKYPHDVIDFLNELEEKTGERGIILSDALELTDERYRKVIEAILQDRRFFILVSDKNKEIASSLLSKYSSPVGIVINKGDNKKSKEGTLSSYLTTDNIEARIFVDSILSQFSIKNNLETLDSDGYIVPDGIIYDRQSLYIGRSEEPFIGQESLKIQLEGLKLQLKEVESALYLIEKDFEELTNALSLLSPISEFECSANEKTLTGFKECKVLMEKIKEIEEKLSSLDFETITRIKEELRIINTKIEDKKEEERKLYSEKGRIDSELSTIERETMPNIITELSSKTLFISSHYEDEWISSIGNGKYLEAIKKERVSMSLRDAYSKMQTSIENKMEEKFKTLTNLRADYNKDYLMGYDILKKDNVEYDKECSDFEDVKLPEYKSQIVEQKNKAYRRFKEDFISKIKDNIETVKSQIDNLNLALKDYTFGSDRYKFLVEPNNDKRKFYAMFMDELLLSGGVNLFSGSFESKYSQEIKELFDILIIDRENKSAKQNEEYERRLKEYIDYRSYLVFDLTVTDSSGNIQRLSKTLSKKSGGETQLPFYIALLASFSQVCKIKSKVRNNTTRLIILDEAFSKMDGERIKESIRLLREFGLQAIFSAPPEKIADIAPLSDTTLIVYRDKTDSVIEQYEVKNNG